MCFWWFNKKKMAGLETSTGYDSVVPVVKDIVLVEPELEYRRYSQKDPAWKDLKIGKTKLTMKDYGCLITSLAMILKRPPYEVLQILNEAGAFNAQGMLIWSIACRVLGFGYVYSKKAPKKPCIAETYISAKFPQHFFLWLGGEKVLDPLDYPVIERKNNYYIVSFRIVET